MEKSVLIGDFLHRIRRPIDLEPASRYKLLTVKLYHKGVILREEKLGADIKSKMYQVREGDFILSGIDARNGAFGIVPPELDGAVVTNDFWYFEIDEKVVDKSFFLELTATHWFDEICRMGSDGTTQRIRLQKNKFFNQKINLPDLIKQRTFNKRFQAIKTSDKALTSELTHQQTLLKKLRQQILQEAIEGKLTADWRAQNPDVEPASELLKRIAAEKEQLAKDKKIKAQKPLPPITDEEKPFELPQGWEWCRLGDICYKITDGFHNTPPKATNGFPYIAATHVKPEKIDWSSCHYVSEQFHRELYTKASPQKGEVLLVNIGAGCGTPAIIDVDFEFSFKNTAILKFNQKALLNTYLFNYFVLSRGRIYEDLTKGGLQPFLSLKIINDFLIPIPTFPEQQAIVAKIEKMLAICDQLEAQITQNQIHTERLMQAVLKEAFSHNSKAEPASVTSRLAPICLML